MEDVYTIKVKTKPDPRNLYPSERRYSASTVSGFAWVHIVLAITLLILTSLTLIIPNENSEFTNTSNFKNSTNNDNSYLLVMAPSLVSIFALTAGLTAILSSVKWYIDKNIALFFIASVVAFLSCLLAICLIITWGLTNNGEREVFVLKHTDILNKNETHLVINRNVTEEQTKLFTNNVLLVNILIATILELILSILSIKISYKGMKNTYNVEDKRGDCVEVVTKIKGTQGGKFHPKLNRIFLAHNKNGFYLKNEKAKTPETSSELYKERMMDFLNESFEGSSNPEQSSEQSETAVKPGTPNKRITPLSWGDSPDHSVYNQNTVNFERVFKFHNDKTDNKE
ncbi:unnamed protein product [Pieris macdunnoughi]|uniref:Uncharacterized protein n=1 Tax=Pieris macdunnoughi TaxID=345717 RepID=A0A821KY59_9NEOP|nr:unnamed protein product [Pieris macdunnoughi]